MPQHLTRDEAKQLTRRRLLDAAGTILRERGLGGLSASGVARTAGIAQPTFYTHFRDKDELLQTLAREKIEGLRSALHEARQRLTQGSQGPDAIAETFRLPLKALVDNPELFRLYIQEHNQPGSPFGEHARRLFEELHQDLAEDLIQIGLPADTQAQREEITMVAEAMIAMTQTLGIGYLDGRYSDLERIVAVLTQFALGLLELRGA